MKHIGHLAITEDENFYEIKTGFSFIFIIVALFMYQYYFKLNKNKWKMFRKKSALDSCEPLPLFLLRSF